MSSLLVNQLYAGGVDADNTSLLTATQLTLKLSSSAATSLSQTELSLYDEAGATSLAVNEFSMLNGATENGYSNFSIDNTGDLKMTAAIGVSGAKTYWSTLEAIKIDLQHISNGNRITIDNTAPSVYVATSSTSYANVSPSEVEVVNGENVANLHASSTAVGLTLVGNSSITLGTNVGEQDQYLSSGGATGTLSWKTVSVTAKTNVYYLYKPVQDSSGVIGFGEFEDATGVLTISTFTNRPVITLTAVTGIEGSVCVPISINTIDVVTKTFTWSAAAEIVAISATLISRG